MSPPPLRRSAGLGRHVGNPEPGQPQSAILDELRAVIVGGGAPPGTSVAVDEVAALFGVSRIPVRECLKTLIGEGLVEHRPQAGYTVARFTVDELLQLFTVRRVLESAALSAGVQGAGPADDAAALSAHRASEESLLAGEAHRYQRESRQFHLTLLRPSGMHRLLGLLEQAWNLTEPLQAMSHVRAGARVRLHCDHSAMLAAFLARDLPALLRVSDTHQARLSSQVAAMPRHTGLFDEPD